jgi:hypothetical protein
MTNLFATLDDLKTFIFRIVDNGGQSADRFTVVTCDGDYFAMSGSPFHPQGVGLTGEGIDVNALSDRIEAGLERDLRWIDLPEDCRRCVMDGLNRGFSDYVESAPAASGRDEALDFRGWDDLQRRARQSGIRGGPVEAIYREGDAYRIRDDERRETDGEDPGPFATFREAVLHMLPEEHDLSGPEYQCTIDMWDETDGPRPLWDRDEEPPAVDADSGFATYELIGPAGAHVAFFAGEDDAYNHIRRLEREADAENRTFVRAAYVVRTVRRS